MICFFLPSTSLEGECTKVKKYKFQKHIVVGSPYVFWIGLKLEFSFKIEYIYSFNIGQTHWMMDGGKC